MNISEELIELMLWRIYLAETGTSPKEVSDNARLAAKLSITAIKVESSVRNKQKTADALPWMCDFSN